MQLLQIVTEQRIFRRHVHLALLHILQKRVKHSPEFRVRQGSHFDPLELPVQPGLLLQRGLIQIGPQLRTDIFKNFFSFIRQLSFSLCATNSVVIDFPSRRSFFEAPRIQMQSIDATHLLSSSSPTTDHVIKGAIKFVKVGIVILDRRALHLVVQPSDRSHLICGVFSFWFIFVVAFTAFLHNILQSVLKAPGDCGQGVDNIGVRSHRLR